MKKRCVLLLPAIILMMFLYCILAVSANASEGNVPSEKETRAYANEHNTWVLCYQQGCRTGSFYQYDATDDCLYFSYSKYACVDVYDTQGVFLYSIIFPERQNGSVSVRCEDNRVYISTKDNILYVFAGTEEVEHIDYDTAAKKGYDFFWFYHNEPHITVDGSWISWLDETGNVIKQIPTPAAIKNTIPSPSGTMAAIPIMGASIVLAAFVLKALLQIAAYKRKKTETF